MTSFKCFGSKILKKKIYVNMIFENYFRFTVIFLGTWNLSHIFVFFLLIFFFTISIYVDSPVYIYITACLHHSQVSEPLMSFNFLLAILCLRLPKMKMWRKTLWLVSRNSSIDVSQKLGWNRWGKCTHTHRDIHKLTNNVLCFVTWHGWI